MQKKTKRPFVITAIVTLCATGIFLLSFLFVYSKSTERYRQALIHDDITYANQNAESISDNFSTYLKLISSFYSSSDYSYLSGLKSGIREAYDYAVLGRLQSSMSTFFNGDDIFYEMAILFDAETPFMCASSFSSYDFVKDCGNGLFQFGDLSPKELLDFCSRNANTLYTYKLSSAQQLRISYANSRQCETSFFIRQLQSKQNGCKAYAILFIDMGSLTKRMCRYDYVAPTVSVFDAEKVIYGNEDLLSFTQSRNQLYYEDTQHFIFTTEIDYLNLNVCISIDKETLNPPLQRWTGFMIILLTTVFAITVILFIVVCTRWLKPFQRMAEHVQSQSDTPISGTRSMEKAIHQISVSQQLMMKEKERIAPVLKRNLLLHLLFDQQLTTPEKEILQGISAFSSDLPYFCVIISPISGFSGLTHYDVADREQWFDKYLPGALYCTTNIDKDVIVLPCHEIGENITACYGPAFQDILKELNTNSQNGMDYAICVGPAVRCIEEINGSYREAEKVLNQAIVWQRSDVIYYGPEDNIPFDYRLRYQDMEKLINLILAGDSATVTDVYDGIVSMVFQRVEARSQLILCQFCNDMNGLLLRFSNQIDEPINSVLSTDITTMSFNDIIDQYRKTVISISDEIAHKQRADSKALTEELQQYIYEHYADSSISLGSIAEAFGMSEAGLSRYFKVNLSINFSDFLEKLRLGKAEALLLEGKMTAQEIAVKVGYVNAATFYKAFKRRYGIPTGEWVKLMRERNE